MSSMFSTKGLIIGAALLTLTGCSAIAGTAGIADSSRTGVIHEVRFAEQMTPVNVRAQIGDEVRWVNQRSTPVQIQFLDNALDDVVCQVGFSSVLRRQQESATIRPNESVSLCFGRNATIIYNARLDSPVAGGQTIESGTIRVGR